MQVVLVVLTRVKLGADKLEKKGFAKQISNDIEGCCKPYQIGEDASGC